MKLRNRSIGVGETFYPFKRLPIELRQMIWRFTLKPRIVDVLYREYKGSRLDRDVTPDEESADITLYSQARLPTALQVSRDSRFAVIPLYPLCFKSNTKPAQIRFNFNIDTLCVDQGLDPYFPVLIRNLSTLERSHIERLAIGDGLGFDEDASVWDKFWDDMEGWVDRIVGIKQIFIFIDVLCAFLWTDANIEDPDSTKQQLEQEFGHVCDNRSVELWPKYPEEIASRLNYNGDMFDVECCHDQDWVKKRTKVVWGWRRFKNSEMQV